MPDDRLTPMEVAKLYVERNRRKRELDTDLRAVKREIEELEPRVLALIEAEQLPESFRVDGASVYTREQLWASARDGDHDRLAAVLRELGLVEYLPSKVNSQSISAYVREHYDAETGAFTELDERLLEALKISTKTNAVVNG